MRQLLVSFFIATSFIMQIASSTAQRVETIVFSTTQTMDGLYVDATGQLYATGGFLDDRLYLIDPTTGQLDTFATGFNGPIHLVKTRSGEVYATDFAPGLSSGTVSRVNANGIAEQIAQVPEGPADIVEDAQGNLLVTQFGNVNTGNGNSISKIAPDSTVSAFASGGLLAAPVGLVQTEDGTIYTANIGDGRIVKIAPDGSQTLFASLPRTTPFTIGHLAYRNGTLYATHFGANQVHAFDLSTGVGRVFAGSGRPGGADGPASEATLTTPNGIAVSITGDTVFVSESATVAAGRNRLRMIISTTNSTKESTYFKTGALSVAPNPVYDGRVAIKLVLAKAAQVELVLVDLHGRTQLQDSVSLFKGNNRHVFEQKPLASGTYMLRATAGLESISALVVVP